MKKSISIILLGLFFCATTNAQTKNDSAKLATNVTVASPDNGIKDIEELDKLVTLSPSLKADLITLINMRKEAVANAKDENEIKTIYESIGAKMISGLSQEQQNKLRLNKDLYDRLIVRK